MVKIIFHNLQQQQQHYYRNWNTIAIVTLKYINCININVFGQLDNENKIDTSKMFFYPETISWFEQELLNFSLMAINSRARYTSRVFIIPNCIIVLFITKRVAWFLLSKIFKEYSSSSSSLHTGMTWENRSWTLARPSSVNFVCRKKFIIMCLAISETQKRNKT